MMNLNNVVGYVIVMVMLIMIPEYQLSFVKTVIKFATCVSLQAAWLSGESWGFECGRLYSNPQLRLLNEFVPGDPRGKFTTLCK